MSAGSFVIKRYQATADTDNYHPIRIQPETEALEIDGVTNAEPPGAINAYPSAQVSKGRRSIGLNARMVTVRFDGAGPANYQAQGTIRLPWLNAATFADIRRGQSGTYLTQPITVVGVSPEAAN
jgi:hypothetical protein